MKILVVEKSAAIRSRLINIIQQLAPQSIVLEADGGECLSMALYNETVDVVILDMAQGCGGGKKLLLALRETQRTAYIIANISHLPGQVKEKVCRMGADAVFDKALDFSQLRDCLARVLRRTEPDGKA